jgi:protease I
MLDGKRICIFIEDGFEDLQVIEPLRAMKDLGAKVLLVNHGLQPAYKGKRGDTIVKADMSVDEVEADDFDAIIIPGGAVADRMCLNERVIDLLKKANEAGKVIAAISEGSQLLVSADMVRGRRLTSLPSMASGLRDAGANWINEPVVTDGNLITACRPADVPRFNRAVMEALTD